MAVRIENSKDHQQYFSELIDTSLLNVANYFKEQSSEESVQKVDEAALTIAGEIVRMQSADSVIEGAQPSDLANVAKKLLHPSFGHQAASNHEKRRACLPKQYKRFRTNLVDAGADDDDDMEELRIVSESVNTVDPLTQLRLVKEGDEYPRALPCGHVYNYSTVMDKRNGQYSLKACVVSACPGNNQPVQRHQLQEDIAVKNYIIRTAAMAGTEVSTQESVEIDDL